MRRRARCVREPAAVVRGVHRLGVRLFAAGRLPRRRTADVRLHSRGSLTSDDEPEPIARLGFRHAVRRAFRLWRQRQGRPWRRRRGRRRRNDWFGWCGRWWKGWNHGWRRDNRNRPPPTPAAARPARVGRRVRPALAARRCPDARRAARPPATRPRRTVAFRDRGKGRARQKGPAPPECSHAPAARVAAAVRSAARQSLPTVARQPPAPPLPVRPSNFARARPNAPADNRARA